MNAKELTRCGLCVQLPSPSLLFLVFIPVEIPFCGPVIFPCINRPHVIYLFLHWWVFGVFTLAVVSQVRYLLSTSDCEDVCFSFSGVYRWSSIYDSFPYEIVDFIMVWKWYMFSRGGTLDFEFWFFSQASDIWYNTFSCCTTATSHSSQSQDQEGRHPSFQCAALPSCDIQRVICRRCQCLLLLLGLLDARPVLVQEHLYIQEWKCQVTW